MSERDDEHDDSRLRRPEPHADGAGGPADPSEPTGSDSEPTQPLRGWPSPPSPVEPRQAPEPTPPAPPSSPGPQGGSFAQAYPEHVPPPGRYDRPRPVDQAVAGPGGTSTETGGWGPPTRPLPAYPVGPQPLGGHHRQPTAPVPRWTWPAIAMLALILGIAGGALGAATYEQLTDGRRGPVPDGLAGVETQEAAPLEADNGSIAAVAQALLPSTVQILAAFGGEDEGATGSGFVLDREGHIVTNNHVVAAAADDEGPIRVVDQTGERHEATVVGRSPVYDLAVLQLSAPADAELVPAALGASQVLNVGDPVVAFGAPLGLSQTVTAGIVSALDRPVTTGDGADDLSYINAVQTDAAINPGNSGGPLVNLAGEVVGVNSAIATTGGIGGEAGNIGVGFAIPIEQVRTTVDQILRTGEARYPVIGAQVQTGGRSSDVGAQITEVIDGTPADRAGLQTDDVITAVDGERVTDGISLIVAIRTHQPGETLEFTVERGGEEERVEITLDAEVG